MEELSDTFSDHTAWVLSRAEEYLDAGDAPGAIASYMSDFSKHPQSAEYMDVVKFILGAALITGKLNNPELIREDLLGFAWHQDEADRRRQQSQNP